MNFYGTCILRLYYWSARAAGVFVSRKGSSFADGAFFVGKCAVGCNIEVLEGFQWTVKRHGLRVAPDLLPSEMFVLNARQVNIEAK